MQNRMIYRRYHFVIDIVCIAYLVLDSFQVLHIVVESRHGNF